eukprot:3579742-Pleurochrysis_carterae.AAC.6
MEVGRNAVQGLLPALASMPVPDELATHTTLVLLYFATTERALNTPAEPSFSLSLCLRRRSSLQTQCLELLKTSGASLYHLASPLSPLVPLTWLGREMLFGAARMESSGAVNTKLNLRALGNASG